MIAATWPSEEPRTTRLLHIDPAGNFSDRMVGDLRTILRKGDLIVVNDAATLPASFVGLTETGESVELRLTGARKGAAWRGVLFGAGDYRMRTEDRTPPPYLAPGITLVFDGVRGRIVHIDAESPRLVDVIFDADDDALWPALYRAGRPVQYAHTAGPLALWHVQTAYAARPWAAEAPSAGFALTWDLLLSLKRQGVGIARLTHAAGLSSTGSDALDARLPLAEHYEIPQETVRAIEIARTLGGRVIAIGTTVSRALEGAAANGAGRLAAGRGITDLRLDSATRRRIVDGIVTGVHEAGTSHFSLLESFAPRTLLERAHRFAKAENYLGHEFGDLILILGETRRR